MPPFDAAEPDDITAYWWLPLFRPRPSPRRRPTPFWPPPPRLHTGPDLS